MQDNDWSSSHSYQFWNKNFTADSGVSNSITLKTIYDPAMSNFIEPKTAAFTNFTSDGSNTITISQFNVSGVFNQGWNFYTLGWKTGSTVFFQALGFRDTHANRSTGNGTVINVGLIGIYQVVGASSIANGRDFFISSGYDYPQDISYRSYGCICRPVSE